jgi:uncharacterized protein YbjT (DUF2867 family)
MAKVTVTGGTGVLGRAVVPRLQADGHQVTVLTRRPAARMPDGVRRVIGDLGRGDGLDRAVAGAETVVHLASQPFRPARVDADGTRALIGVLRRSGGNPHLLYVSIVGVDKIPWPYYKRKQRAESLVSASGFPFTIQRATQFHDLVLMAMASAARAPVVIVPSGTSCQPVHAGDVAERLAQIVWTGPAGGFSADLGGPQIPDAADLARDVLSALGKRRPVRPVRVPGRVGAGFRAGHHLAASTPRGAHTGVPTWMAAAARSLESSGCPIPEDGYPYRAATVRAVRHEHHRRSWRRTIRSARPAFPGRSR